MNKAEAAFVGYKTVSGDLSPSEIVSVLREKPSLAPVFPNLPETTLARIVKDMNQTGFGVAENCIDDAQMLALQAFIMRKVADAGGEYVAFEGNQPVSGTFLEALSLSPEFNHACRTIYRLGTGKSAPEKACYQLLRCLSGRTGDQHAYFFHYDSYVVTALVPVLMPSKGQTGDLIMFPNQRRIRKNYLTNLMDKVLLDNRLTQTLLKRGCQSGSLRPTRIRMSPGNIYFFWGYRSVHANEPCDHDEIRATAVFHYLNPHADNRMRRMMRHGTS